jgi:murein L,D-transpeptidase YafK
MRVEVLVLSIAAGALAHAAAPDDHPCLGGDEVVIHTRHRALLLCQDGEPRAHYAVALGSGGLGKQREGDRRTPLGRYPLGAPRRSWSYGVFVPVGYPTAEQARAGFTGGAIGIHGPRRQFAGAGLLNTAGDWTAGCIAVGSDREIAEIAAWIRTRRNPAVRIE